jgi:S1-C subfamily serine protease
MRPFHIHRVWLVAIALGVSAARADEGIYEYLLRSTVWIVNPINGRHGTGSLLDENERLVVTAAHIVERASAVVLFFPRFDDQGLVTDRKLYLRNRDKLGIPAQVVQRDSGRDLALLKLDYLPYDASPLPIASGGPARGSRVHIVGNPDTSGSQWVYETGHVRQVRRLQRDERSDYSPWVIEVQSPMWHGTSGGPAVNDGGELVGVASVGTRSSEHELEEAEYCVDASEVRTVLDDYLANGELTRNLREMRPHTTSHPIDAETSGRFVVVNGYRPDITVTINGKSYTAPMGRSQLWVPYRSVEAYLPGYQSKQIWDHWHWAGDHYEMVFQVKY